MDLDGTRRAIASERLDVLLYLALPTEKFTVFLSAARLAPVQVRSILAPALVRCGHTGSCLCHVWGLVDVLVVDVHPIGWSDM